ncbi:nucleotidyltransferase [Fibrisoma montanum]|nr:nucleotidyltransferase [Fibrisoma montanum]
MLITEDQSTERLKSFFHLMVIAAKLYRANPNNPPKLMDINGEDVQQLLGSLYKHNVRYLLVGGMAGIVHGHNRTTHDMDVWVQIGQQNKDNLITALLENEVAGATYLKDVPLLFGWTSVQVGRYGFTLDMGYAMKAFSEVDFDACYNRALDASFDGVPFKVIHLNDLIIEKKATGRPKDLADVEELLKVATINRNALDPDKMD